MRRTPEPTEGLDAGEPDVVHAQGQMQRVQRRCLPQPTQRLGAHIPGVDKDQTEPQLAQAWHVAHHTEGLHPLVTQWIPGQPDFQTDCIWLGR